MQQAMHAARLVAAHSALLSLLYEAQGDSPQVDAVTVTLTYSPDADGLDVSYLSKGVPVAGEGM